MPGGWKNSLCERWVRRPTLGLSNFAQNATVKAIIEDRLFTTATARPAPAGDRLYFHNQAIQFDAPWVKAPQLGHYFPGDIALNSDGTILLAEMPVKTNLKVTRSEPGIKGDTATNTLKPATLETGAEIRVPLFINEGDLIQIDTRDGSYLSRA